MAGDLRSRVLLTQIHAAIHYLDAGSEILLVPETSQGQLDETVNQLGVRNSACFPHLGIHADLCEAGDRVDLVDQNLTAPFNEKVDSSHPIAAQRSISSDRDLPNVFDYCPG